MLVFQALSLDMDRWQFYGRQSGPWIIVGFEVVSRRGGLSLKA